MTIAPPQLNLALLNDLVNHYFSVVPLTLRQHCSLTSRATMAVLQHFGMEARLLPCQLWHAGPTHNLVIGFTDSPPAPNRWNGHVVCEVGDYLIDAATFAFFLDAGLEAPSIVIVKKFQVPTQVIARLNVNERERIWWYQPPAGFDTHPFEESQDKVQELAQALIGKLTQLGYRPAASVTAACVETND